MGLKHIYFFYSRHLHPSNNAFYIFTFFIESEINARGILREVWDRTKDDTEYTTRALREWNVFGRQRSLWNLIQMMDAPTNFGKYYAQKLSAYMKVKNP